MKDAAGGNTDRSLEAGIRGDIKDNEAESAEVQRQLTEAIERGMRWSGIAQGLASLRMDALKDRQAELGRRRAELDARLSDLG